MQRTTNVKYMYMGIMFQSQKNWPYFYTERFWGEKNCKSKLVFTNISLIPNKPLIKYNPSKSVYNLINWQDYTGNLLFLFYLLSRNSALINRQDVPYQCLNGILILHYLKTPSRFLDYWWSTWWLNINEPSFSLMSKFLPS